MSFVNRAQSEHDDTLPSCSPFIISSPDPDVTFSATFDPTTSPAANFPLTPLDQTPLEQTPLEQATPAVELYDDGDAAFLSQSSSAYTVDSRCEFLNVKQSEASKNKAMKKLRADEKKMRIREEEVAVRNALCDAGIKPEDLERDCGLGSCRPRACHGCANIKMFIFTLCVFSTLSGMMIPGYLNSVITTIETRFQIGSSISGIIAASVEFGSLVAVIFVSYFGGNRHIPKWIGCGAILKGIGSIMFIIPHLATDRYSLYDAGLNTTDDNICRTPDEHSRLNCVDDQSGNAVLVVVLIIAQILVGTGGSPLFTLGTTYIDNHVSKEKSPAYLSFVYATSALGPVCGFALGALMLQFYVDFTTVDPAALGITPADPRWVGAWWLGFVVGGILLLIMAIPMFAFPKVMHAEKARLYLEQKQADPTQRGTYNATANDTLMRRASTETTQQQQQQQPDEQYGRRLQDIPSATYNLIANPIYLVTCFGICCEIIIVSGFIVFLPKFLETQFGMTKSIANLLTGGIAIPAAVVGIMVGGYLLKRFQMTPKDAVQMMLALNFLGVLGFSLLIFLGCDNVRMAGATLPYFNSSGHEILEANLTSPCNMDCSCSSNSLEPVCGINGITYFSACHAGCTQMYASQEMTRLQNYSDCACILGNMNLGQEVIMSPMATGGPCKVTCQTLTPFMVLLFFMTLLVAGTHMPLLMLTLRSVREEERSFALGMQFVILRLFAYIPAPIMFGNTIDSTCLLWKEHCGQQGGCLMYDIVMFRFKYIGISAGLKLLAAVFFIALYYLIKQQDMQDFKRPMMIGDLVKSVTSLASGMDVDSALAHRHHGTFHQRKGHRRSKSTGCQPTVQDLDLSAAIYNTDRSPGPRSPGTQSLGGTIHYPKSKSQSNVNAPTVHFQITKPGVESAL